MTPLHVAVWAAVALTQPAAEAAPAIELDLVLVTLIEQVEVPSRAAGPLAEVLVREGDLVEQGARLAGVEDIEAVLAHERAEADLQIALKQSGNDIAVRFAEKSLEVARAELDRANQSIERFRRSISDSEMDEVRLRAERAALEVEQAVHEFEVAQLTTRLKEHELAQARHAVERHAIVAPLAGMVVELNHRSGEWVQPGETVLRIVRIDRLRVEGEVAAADAALALAGAPVTLEVDFPGQPAARFPGTLVFVSPEIDARSGRARVWAEVDNAEMRLRPGLKGRMTIARPAVAVPAAD